MPVKIPGIQPVFTNILCSRFRYFSFQVLALWSLARCGDRWSPTNPVWATHVCLQQIRAERVLGRLNGEGIRKVTYYILIDVVRTFNSCTKCVGSPRKIHNLIRPIATQFSRYGCLDDTTTERSFDSQTTRDIT